MDDILQMAFINCTLETVIHLVWVHKHSKFLWSEILEATVRGQKTGSAVTDCACSGFISHVLVTERTLSSVPLSQH
jgi:hypothetical protein